MVVCVQVCKCVQGGVRDVLKRKVCEWEWDWER